jgi:hypothetical protein
VPELTSATNTGIEATGEYSKYFTGPAIVGADFLNVYSNAIFFSEQGDGKVTSFHERGSDWMNTSTTTDVPTGIYYKPQQGVYGSRYAFTIYEDAGSGDQTYTPLSIGNKSGFDITARNVTISAENSASSTAYIGADWRVDMYTPASGMTSIDTGNISIAGSGWLDIDSTGVITMDSQSNVSINAGASGVLWLGANSSSSPTTSAGDIILDAGDDIKLIAIDRISLSAADDIEIDTDKDIDIDADGYMTVDVDGRIDITSVDSDITLEAAAADQAIYLTSIGTEDGTPGYATASQPNSADGGVVLKYIPTSTSSSGGYVVWGTGSGRLLLLTSSRRYKENIKDLEDSSWIHSLRPVSFKPKDKTEGNKTILGFIAEEMAEVSGAEELVNIGNDGLPHSIDHMQLLAPIIKELQNQRREIEELKKQIKG